MSSYALLDQAEEDTLHKSRLLNVEEKPFKRITKRLLSADSLISAPPVLPPTPPPDANGADEAAAAHEAEKYSQLKKRSQWREDVLLDFAAFESSIVRIQFLLTSNAKERERYAAEKLKIQATAQAVRENTAELRVQLEEVQKTLARRKAYDELAEKITNNRLLRPREDQHANLDKLNAEIANLEKESRAYAQTWAERREQFGRIIEDGLQLRRLIRDEKEEVERKEGMEEEGEDGDGPEQVGRSSEVGTPRHEGDAAATHAGYEREVPIAGLNVAKTSASRSRSPLRMSQTATDEPKEKEAREDDEDTNMAEDGEVAESDVLAPSLQGEEGVAAPAEGLVANVEDEAEKENGDTMDTS